MDKQLKAAALYALKDAERRMHKYAASCEIGPERTKAFAIYENIRRATVVEPSNSLISGG